MKLSLRLLTLMTTLLMGTGAYAQYTMEDMQVLRNDKEPLISVFSKRERSKLEKKYENTETPNLLVNLFYSAISEISSSENRVCELNLIDVFGRKLQENNLSNDKDSIQEYLKVIRSQQAIDDVLYLISSGALKDYFEFRDLNFSKTPKNLRKASEKLLDKNDLEDLFEGFDEYPDEKSRCSYQELSYIRANVRNSKGLKSTKKEKDIKPLIRQAYLDKLIPVESYYKLDYLNNKAKLSERDLWLHDYLNIIMRAKNQMIPVKNDYNVINIEDEDSFSSERIKRFSKLTRRRVLYRKYDETQIILLAQVLQKASRRMGVDPDTKSSTPFISQEFWVTGRDGQVENYVEKFELDPQSQYNLSRRLMRKDMTELQMMDMFTDVKITYNDIVVAALETGYISLDDISHVVKYDDLWNPEKTKWERISGYIFTGLGYSTFFVPPPWNVVATIALGVVEGVVDSKFSNGADNDNPATFIE